MKYQCKRKKDGKISSWTGEITSIKWKEEHCEMEVTARGSYFHIIIGPHEHGHYVCIPNWNVGCELSNYTDLFWNTERISQQNIPEIDAISISHAISTASCSK